MDGLSIGEVARRAGVAASALRYWEDAGLLPAPRRVGGRRRYDADVLPRVQLLRSAQGAGFTLAEIRTLFHSFGAQTPPGERWNVLAHAKLRELDDLIARAEQMKRAIMAGMECGCVRLEDCVLAQPAQAL
jgi:MerR family redox-sensitive transcriptional activator SoxR